MLCERLVQRVQPNAGWQRELHLLPVGRLVLRWRRKLDVSQRSLVARVAVAVLVVCCAWLGNCHHHGRWTIHRRSRQYRQRRRRRGRRCRPLRLLRAVLGNRNFCFPCFPCDACERAANRLKRAQIPQALHEYHVYTFVSQSGNLRRKAACLWFAPPLLPWSARVSWTLEASSPICKLVTCGLDGLHEGVAPSWSIAGRPRAVASEPDGSVRGA